jgi:predicted metal-binding membrane protein
MVLPALALGCALAWWYLARGARLGMDAWSMTGFALFPHRHHAALDAAMSGMSMAPSDIVLLAAMWLAMMVAMMAPSAAPLILLYARGHRHAVAQGRLPARAAATGSFTLGYFAIWGAFSLLAAGAQYALESVGAMSGMAMGLHSRWASGGVLLLAGAYQFTPLKRACLSACRMPAAFLAQHWRPGARGAFRLGWRHGLYCLGCCALLMALLFVGGVMNLAWIAALAMLVMAEKWLPRGGAQAHASGVLLLAWGLATFFA